MSQKRKILFWVLGAVVFLSALLLHSWVLTLIALIFNAFLFFSPHFASHALKPETQTPTILPSHAEGQKNESSERYRHLIKLWTGQTESLEKMFHKSNEVTLRLPNETLAEQLKNRRSL